MLGTSFNITIMVNKDFEILKRDIAGVLSEFFLSFITLAHLISLTIMIAYMIAPVNIFESMCPKTAS
jgi:hypothetical protein